MTTEYEKEILWLFVLRVTNKILLPLDSEYADSTLPLEKSSREFATGSSGE